MLVKCPCNCCGNFLEFEDGDFFPGLTIDCPHCGLKTVLSVPKSANKPLAPQQDIRGNKTATPKQVAFLAYMGVPNPEQLSKDDASALIDSGGYFPEATSMAELERQSAHKGRWHTERLYLYPELYA